MERFLGVRYATAERFGHPVPVPDPVSAEQLDCRLVACPQPHTGNLFHYGNLNDDLPQSEDCLRLSVFTPDTGASLPVLIWIHGGYYLTGSGLISKYDATRLASSGGIVVFSISYRLGILGFCNGVPLALEDQECAIRWIIRNARLFGGDPGRITVMGQSAGAHSVLCHISRLKDPLFSKAIVMSAPFLEKSMHSMRKITSRFMDALPCPPEEATCEQILKAQARVSRSIIPGMPFAPVCRISRPETVMPGLEKVIVMYQKDDAVPFAPKHMVRPVTEMVFGIPARRYAARLRAKGFDARVLVRDWGHGKARFGAIHFMEIPLLLGDWKCWKRGPFMDGITGNDFAEESERFMKQITDFVKS